MINMIFKLKIKRFKNYLTILIVQVTNNNLPDAAILQAISLLNEFIIS